MNALPELRVPFNRPYLAGGELAYIQRAIKSGHISGDGAFTKECSVLLERELGVSRALLTPSCTQALEMAALLLETGPGDEVILPSYTFVSTVNAFALRGASPVFVDIRRDTLNMDETKLHDLITPHTKAILPVHYAGVGCEMEAILETAFRHKVSVVEDNAHGLFGKYRGKCLGTFGDLAAQSFHETKNFSCGEGGALLINNPKYTERAEIIREKGTDRSRFFRNQVEKYTWIDIGSSYLISEILAAFLLAQFDAREEIQARRHDIWHYYHNRLAMWARENKVRLPHIPSECEQSYHLFYLLLPSKTARDAFIAHLRANGVLSIFHYVPLHLSEMGRKFGYKRGDFPVTEWVYDRLVRLPFYNGMTEDDLALVIETVRQFRCY